MSVSVSGIYSVQPAVEPATVQASTRIAPQPSPQTSADTVTLSQAAQVNQMNLQGESPSQISQNLGIAVNTVDLDLGVVVAQTASTPSVAPAGRTHPAPAHAAPAPAVTAGAGSPPTASTASKSTSA
jgi:hypothetical protein